MRKSEITYNGDDLSSYTYKKYTIKNIQTMCTYIIRYSLDMYVCT